MGYVQAHVAHSMLFTLSKQALPVCVCTCACLSYGLHSLFICEASSMHGCTEGAACETQVVGIVWELVYQMHVESF